MTARSRAMPIAALALLASCSDKQNTLIIVTARVSDARIAPAIVVLRTTVEFGALSRSRDFAHTPQAPINFPATFSIELDRTIAGPIKMDVQGIDPGNTVRAHWVRDMIALAPGKTSEMEIALDCFGDCPPPVLTDGGPTTGDGPAAGVDAPVACGNGKVDHDETCDIAIGAGRPGACPARDCNDGIACTKDVHLGEACKATCEWIEIRASQDGDSCRPAGAAHDTDSDCSVTCNNGTIEAGETCDLAIAAGKPGACPSAHDCQDAESCTIDQLISAGTCAAVCVNREISARNANDGCCPANASHGTDLDCPVVCGNGILEDGETCDTGIAPTIPGACPAKCDDGNPCTSDRREGSGCNVKCVSTAITDLKNGDGCCLSHANATVDADCKPICGNGVVEPGEICDKSIPTGGSGVCPTACPSNGCLAGTLEGKVGDCSARCVPRTIAACSAGQHDGCCPTGCTFATDQDCSATCGNGNREAGETCDTALPANSSDACPAACSDGQACTTDVLDAAGTCNARCVSSAISSFVDGDQCCPMDGNHNTDADCAPTCGNRAVEAPSELCDKGITAGLPGACPAKCPLAQGCTLYQLTGDAALCTAACKGVTIVDCRSGDGCCPSTCNAATDNDCTAVCGDGVVEAPTEKCDKGITAGNTGACASVCDDGMACTRDVTVGSVADCTRTCTFNPIGACTGGDGCCPSACTPLTDTDCAPRCGDGDIQMGEFCDPPASCPTKCADDGDPCTREKLQGDPTQCTARCVADPIVECLPTPDMCCPSNCAVAAGVAAKDPDCAVSLASPLL